MKTVINPYLTFEGNCEEAFEFYKSVFGGDFAYIGRFKDMPPQEGCEVSEEFGKKIMHVSLPIGGGTTLMGSDNGGDWAPKLIFGNNITISIGSDTKEDTDRIFSGLSAGGKITMPLNMTFWGAYFGMFTDKFGVNWMVSSESEQAK